MTPEEPVFPVYVARISVTKNFMPVKEGELHHTETVLLFSDAHLNDIKKSNWIRINQVWTIHEEIAP